MIVLKKVTLRLSMAIFSCFFLTHFSWALQDGSEQLKHDQSLNGDIKFISDQEATLPREQKISVDQKELLTRGQKVLLLNVGAWSTIAAFGAKDWEYGKSKFHFKNEGWFERETGYGGADKLSHAWSAYAMSHLFSYTYRKWQYSDKQANLYGALSSFGVSTFMELADGFSPSQGFSHEDMVMNILGCGLGYILGEYPGVANMIDFRLEFTPKFDSDDLKIGTRYERYTYLFVVKADGFDFIKNPYLRYLEFHMGYNTRGYDDYVQGGPDDRRRRISAGLGFNVSKLLQKYVKTSVLDYVQLPYTSLRSGFPLD